MKKVKLKRLHLLPGSEESIQIVNVLLILTNNGLIKFRVTNLQKDCKVTILEKKRDDMKMSNWDFSMKLYYYKLSRLNDNIG